jgi:hypothetical protein
MRNQLPIAVTCGCGTSAPLRAGSPDWTCPACGQNYTTAGLDTGELGHKLSVIKRQVWAGAVLILVVIGALAVYRPAVLLAAPVLLGGYYFCYLPRYRRQLRALYESLPEWRLTRT